MTSEDQQLGARLTHTQRLAWDWVANNFAFMSPFSHTSRERFEFCTKVLAELLIVISRSRNMNAVGSSVASGLAGRAFSETFVRPGFQSFLVQHLAKLPGLSLTASFAECGLIDDRFTEHVRAIALPATITAGEYSPATFMDIAHSAIRCGLAWDGPPLPALFDRTLLAALPPDLSDADDSDYYAFTHAVFFYTDFGALARIPGRAMAYLADNVANIMFDNCSRRNTDLLGEFIACDLYLDISARTAILDYLNHFLDTQEPDGSFRNGEPAKDGESDWEEFLQKYHTTFVGLLVTSAAARRWCEPESSWLGDRHPSALGAMPPE